MIVICSGCHSKEPLYGSDGIEPRPAGFFFVVSEVSCSHKTRQGGNVPLFGEFLPCVEQRPPQTLSLTVNGENSHLRLQKVEECAGAGRPPAGPVLLLIISGPASPSPPGCGEPKTSHSILSITTQV